MKNVTLIAAIGKNNELGKDNKLIWRLKEDMKFFKENTIGKQIAMGKNTFLSLPGLLAKRKHLIVTKENLEEKENIKVFHTLENLLEYIENTEEEIMIIGGARLYDSMLKYANKMLLTEIEKSAEADVYFPTFKKEEWSKKILSKQEENKIKYKHLLYTRK